MVASLQIGFILTLAVLFTVVNANGKKTINISLVHIL